MKIEKGKLYYDYYGKYFFKTENSTEFIENSVSDKIAIHCTTNEDWDYVVSNGYKLTSGYYGDTCYTLYNGEYSSFDYYKRHRYHIITIEQFKEFYPEKIMKTKKVYTEATPLLIDLWKNYKGKKSGEINLVKFFDNCTMDEETGNFHAQWSHYEYKQHDYTHLTEQEFIEFMDLQPSTQGYKESTDKLDYELDFDFITQMAERMASNKGKYEPYNWQKPMDVEKLKQSLMRHVIEVMKGNYNDDGRDMGHVEAIAANAMMINYQIKNNG